MPPRRIVFAAQHEPPDRAAFPREVVQSPLCGGVKSVGVCVDLLERTVVPEQIQQRGYAADEGETQRFTIEVESRALDASSPTLERLDSAQSAAVAPAKPADAPGRLTHA